MRQAKRHDSTRKDRGRNDQGQRFRIPKTLAVMAEDQPPLDVMDFETKSFQRDGREECKLKEGLSLARMDCYLLGIAAQVGPQHMELFGEQDLVGPCSLTVPPPKAEGKEKHGSECSPRE